MSRLCTIPRPPASSARSRMRGSAWNGSVTSASTRRGAIIKFHRHQLETARRKTDPAVPDLLRVACCEEGPSRRSGTSARMRKSGGRSNGCTRGSRKRGCAHMDVTTRSASAIRDGLLKIVSARSCASRSGTRLVSSARSPTIGRESRHRARRRCRSSRPGSPNALLASLRSAGHPGADVLHVAKRLSRVFARGRILTRWIPLAGEAVEPACVAIHVEVLGQVRTLSYVQLRSPLPVAMSSPQPGRVLKSSHRAIGCSLLWPMLGALSSRRQGRTALAVRGRRRRPRGLHRRLGS